MADALRLALEPRARRKLGDRRAGFVEAFGRRELRRHLRGADRGRVGLPLVGRVLGLGTLGLGVLGLNFSGLDLFGDGLAAVRTPRGAAGPPRAAAAPLVLALLLALGARVLGEERLPVGDRNLVVVGMDFAEGEEAVPVPAIFDERRLKRRFDPRHLGEIDVPAKLSPRSGFEVEFLDLLAAHYHHPRLFRVGGIDKHLVCHDELSTWRSPTALLARRPTRARGAIHVAASWPEAARWFGGCR